MLVLKSFHPILRFENMLAESKKHGLLGFVDDADTAWMSLTKRIVEFLEYWMGHLGDKVQPRLATSALLQVAASEIADHHNRYFVDFVV